MVQSLSAPTKPSMERTRWTWWSTTPVPALTSLPGSSNQPARSTSRGSLSTTKTATWSLVAGHTMASRQGNKRNINRCTWPGNNACTRFDEICSCCCQTVLPGPARVLFNFAITIFGPTTFVQMLVTFKCRLLYFSLQSNLAYEYGTGKINLLSGYELECKNNQTWDFGS